MIVPIGLMLHDPAAASPGQLIGPLVGHPIAATLELSLAPVFLLVAIGSILNVITQRLARVVDRARFLRAEIADGRCDPTASPEARELSALARRVFYANWAVNFSAVAALIVAILVGVIFISGVVGQSSARFIEALFIMALSAIVLALSAFIVEISIATRTLRIGDIALDPKPAAKSTDQRS
ncbi:MAG: DUF2721 domain-containing protein [Pseudomonadota bacterium]